jgi:hypothetical protein
MKIYAYLGSLLRTARGEAVAAAKAGSMSRRGFSRMLGGTLLSGITLVLLGRPASAFPAGRSMVACQGGCNLFYHYACPPVDGYCSESWMVVWGDSNCWCFYSEELNKTSFCCDYDCGSVGIEDVCSCCEWVSGNDPDCAVPPPP